MLVQFFYIKDVLKTTKQYQQNKKRGHNINPLLHNMYTNSSGRWVRAGWLVQFSCLCITSSTKSLHTKRSHGLNGNRTWTV